METQAAQMLGTAFDTIFSPGCSLITMVRNSICKDFLASKSDRLVFVDSDVSWDIGSLLKLASYPVDIVGGAYRYKDPNERYPVFFLKSDKGIWTDDRGLVEVAALPGGFTCISRSALLRIREKFPDRVYQWGGQEFYAYFDNPYRDGSMIGEDIGFCMMAREAGEKVYLDPSLRLTHVEGAQEYTGRIEDWLREGKWKTS